MTNMDILASSKFTDIEKLMFIFENDKNVLKQNNPELYYALLAIRDDIKRGYNFIKGGNK